MIACICGTDSSQCELGMNQPLRRESTTYSWWHVGQSFIVRLTPFEYPPPTPVGFLLLLISGRARFSTCFCHRQDEADAARAEGTIVYAVGVGSGPTEAILLDIGGEEDNVFDVNDFDELDGKCLGPKNICVEFLFVCRS